MLRIIFVLVVIVYSFYLFYNSKYIDRVKPEILISKKVNNKDKIFLTHKAIKTSLEENPQHGLKLELIDDTKIKFIALYFKNKQTKNKYLRFYINKNVNKKNKTILLNKTNLKKVIFGNHNTTIKVVVVDSSFNKNETKLEFKITNKGKKPNIFISDRNFDIFKEGNIGWGVFKSNSKDNINISHYDYDDLSVFPIKKNKFGILFFHSSKNKYLINFSDSYGNTTKKEISFLDTKEKIKPLNKCIERLSTLKINGEIDNKVYYSKKYKKNLTFSNGIILDKGICNNKNYFVSIIDKGIYQVFYGQISIPSTKKYSVNTNLEVKNNDIKTYILRNGKFYDSESYFYGIKNIFNQR